LRVPLIKAISAYQRSTDKGSGQNGVATFRVPFWMGTEWTHFGHMKNKRA